MPHLAGKCDCGREIHFPKTATIGYQWTCRKCGKVWTLSNQGKPLYQKGSKAPRPQKKLSRNSFKKSQSSKNSFNWSSIIGILVVIGFIILMLTFIF